MLGRTKKSLRTRQNRMRNLRLEGLEDRKLLAGDIVDSLPYHNPLIAQDVDYDFNVSPRDVLLIVNELNGQGARDLDDGPVDPNGKAFIDVNGDGALSPIDALAVVNFLNGEGETGPLVTYTAELTDGAGSPITQVVVGQTFRLTVFVQDTRSTGPTGVFQNAIDVGVTGDGDVDFPLGSGSFLSNIEFGSRDPEVDDEYTAFPNGRLGTDRANELLNEIGSTWSDFFNAPQPEGGVYPLFSTEFRADSAGTVNFVLNQHELEEEPTSQVNVYDPTSTLPDEGRIDPSMISYETVSINVITDPTAPLAVNDTVPAVEDTALLLVGGDVDLLSNDQIQNDPASVISISTVDGTLGTLNGNTYTPPADYFGLDTLVYTIEDSRGLQSSATVTINVAAVNDPPTATADSFSVDEESEDNPLDVLANDSPGPGETSDSLTIASITQPSNGTATISADGLTILYTPNADYLGPDSLTYIAEDSEGVETSSTTVSIEVEATVLPRARRDSVTVDEDSTDNSIDVLANDRANEGETKFFVGIASDPANGQVTVDDNGTPDDATDDKVLYTPTANFSGTDSFTYTMNDTGDGSVASTGTVNITVSAINDPVELSNDDASTAEDQELTIAASVLLANDSPGAGEAGQELNITSVSALTAGGGAVVLVGSDVTYTPADDFNGSFEFTYTAADNGSPVSSGTATVTVAVSPVNDDPIAADDSATTAEDTALTLAAATLLSNDVAGPANESGQTLSVTGVSAASTQGGTVTLGSSGAVYTPASDFNGTDTFTYTISDGAGGTATATVTVSVSAVNDAPVGVADSVRAFKDNALDIEASELLSNDSTGPADEASQTLTIASVQGATNGSVVLNADGSVTFTPDPGFTGAASFTYVARDSGGADSDPTTVAVTVEEFVPTTISGTVWMDENNDGVIDVDVDGDGDADFRERRMGGVEVTLTGTSLGQPIEPIVMMTLADGSYSFDNLGPGRYVVNFASPTLTIDGHDVAGSLGDMDSVENQFTIDIAQPGGADASGYNFGVLGISGGRGRILGQLASGYIGSSPGKYDGALFAIGENNDARWGALLDGFDGVQFAEAVLSDDGSQLVLSVVDANENIHSAVLGDRQFVKLHAGAETLIRVIGDFDSFDFQEVGQSATPPISASGYLDSVDEIFAQEGWGDEQ
ncbi:MAG: hypothetical protein Aurels2KO_20980 [Aureliella sp.]